jgi:hypothetical protein
MIPWQGRRPLTSSVVEVFNGLRGEARAKAIATGNYDELVKQQAQQPEREPGDDNEPKPQRRSAFDTIDEEVPL